LLFSVSEITWPKIFCSGQQQQDGPSNVEVFNYQLIQLMSLSPSWLAP